MKNWGGVIGLLLLATSCGEANNSFPESPTQRQQQLVFNDREVDQIRGELLRADDGTDYLQYQQSAYFRAHAANSVGVIERECNGVLRGSAVLSTVKRLTTVWHVVQQEAADYPVVFGGTADSEGNFIDDLGIIGLPYSDDDAFRSAVHEENYLLANRLFALGLHDWAKSNGNGVNARKHLRRWIFRPVSGSAGLWSGQGMVSVAPSGAATGRDLAVLEAVGPEVPGEIPTPPSGAFGLVSPGVFFDSVGFRAMDSVNVESDQPLSAVFATVWPDDSSSTDPSIIVPLAARNGYEMGTDDHSPSDKNCRDQTIRHSFTGLLRNTLDLRSGASGGAVLYEDPHEHLGDSSPLLHRTEAIAVHVGDSGPNLTRKWQDHTKISEPSPTFDGVWANYATAIVSDDLSLTNYRPPAPSFGPTDRQACSSGSNSASCIACAEFDAAGGCSEFGSEPAETGPVIGGVEIEHVGIAINDEASENPGSGGTNDIIRRSIQCWFDENGAPWKDSSQSSKQPGVIVGFLGGTTAWNQPSGSSVPAVGSLFAVCAPLSSLSYTENWQFLTLKGGRVEYGHDSIGGRLRWSSFEEALRYAYELRQDDSVGSGQYTRVAPVSMKLCPPNQVVTGVVWNTTGTGTYGPHHVVGLRSLRCAAVSKSAAPTGHSLYSLHANPSDFAYTQNGQPLQLHQRIGNPSTGGQVHQLCNNPNLPIAIGIEMTHDNAGQLVQVSLYCGDEP